MQFTTNLFALSLAAAPALAVPAVPDLSRRSSPTFANGSIACTPSDNYSGTSIFFVDPDTAQDETRSAGFKPGVSGDPHLFDNNFTWGKPDCDKENAVIYEFPIYPIGSKQSAWKLDTPTAQQQPTPIRVIFASVNGQPEYCGVVIHAFVTERDEGSAGFVKCVTH